jgi:hypothetical protein
MNKSDQLLINQLRGLREVGVRPEFRGKFEELLIPSLTEGRSVNGWLWWGRPLVLGLLLVLLFGSGLVWAAYQSGPGDLLYPIKEAVNQLVGGGEARSVEEGALVMQMEDAGEDFIKEESVEPIAEVSSFPPSPVVTLSPTPTEVVVSPSIEEVVEEIEPEVTVSLPLIEGTGDLQVGVSGTEVGGESGVAVGVGTGEGDVLGAQTEAEIEVPVVEEVAGLVNGLLNEDDEKGGDENGIKLKLGF